MKIVLTLILCVFISQANSYKQTNTYIKSLDYAQVLKVASSKKNSTWCFDVTLVHNDEGWEHYANVWEVLDLKGNLLAKRILAHPHGKEQAFTRSLCSVKIPKSISKVLIRAKCTKHSYGGKEIYHVLDK